MRGGGSLLPGCDPIVWVIFWWMKAERSDLRLPLFILLLRVNAGAQLYINQFDNEIYQTTSILLFSFVYWIFTSILSIRKIEMSRKFIFSAITDVGTV